MYQEVVLPYDVMSLLPDISSDTLQYHYEIYQNYVKQLNQLVKENGIHRKDTYEQILKKYDMYPLPIRGKMIYYAGAVMNHELYFANMSKEGSKKPVGKIKDAIEKKYGSYEQFLEIIKKEAKNLFGSGYVFLCLDEQNELVIAVMSNQENPYLYRMVPLLVIDLWEHSYYLDYQYHRDVYLDAFFRVIDFDVVNDRYEKALQKL